MYNVRFISKLFWIFPFTWYLKEVASFGKILIIKIKLLYIEKILLWSSIHWKMMETKMCIQARHIDQQWLAVEWQMSVSYMGG